VIEILLYNSNLIRRSINMKNRLTSNDITISTLLPSLTVRHSYYKAIPHHFRDTETVEIRLHHLRLLEL
jgi:hypothetical protein